MGKVLLFFKIFLSKLAEEKRWDSLVFPELEKVLLFIIKFNPEKVKILGTSEGSQFSVNRCDSGTIERGLCFLTDHFLEPGHVHPDTRGYNDRFFSR